MAEQQQEPRAGFIAVGRIVRPWGLDGDVKTEVLTDFPERFEAGNRVWAGGIERGIQAARSHKGALYLKLSGIDTPEEAESLRDAWLEIPESQQHALPEGDFYQHQLIGLPVRTVGGEELGSVAEVFDTGPHSVLVVHGSRGEVLVPFIEDVVRRVDLAASIIEIDPLEGMIQEPRVREDRPRGRRRTKPRADAPPRDAVDAPE